MEKCFIITLKIVSIHQTKNESMKKIILSLLLVSGAFAYEAAGQSVAAAPVVVTESVSLDEFVGKYKFEDLPFEYIEFSIKEGNLYVKAGDREGPLKPIKDTRDRFENADNMAKFSFLRNEEKQIIKVVLDYDGSVFEGKKDASKK